MSASDEILYKSILISDGFQFFSWALSPRFKQYGKNKSIYRLVLINTVASKAPERSEVIADLASNKTGNGNGKKSAILYWQIWALAFSK